jgi:hypothetical protein
MVACWRNRIQWEIKSQHKNRQRAPVQLRLMPKEGVPCHLLKIFPSRAPRSVLLGRVLARVTAAQVTDKIQRDVAHTSMTFFEAFMSKCIGQCAICRTLQPKRSKAERNSTHLRIPVRKKASENICSLLSIHFAWVSFVGERQRTCFRLRSSCQVGRVCSSRRRLELFNGFSLGGVA